MAWSILLYGAEAWTLRKDDIRQLKAYEMWFWKRMLKIKDRDKTSNAEVLQKG